MEQLRLDRTVVRMGFAPVLLTKRREAVKEQAICLHQDEENWAIRASSCCLWEYWAVYRQASCEFGMPSVNRNWTHHSWTHQSRDLHKQRAQKRKPLWILNKNLLYMFFHWSTKQSNIAPPPLCSGSFEGISEKIVVYCSTAQLSNFRGCE